MLAGAAALAYESVSADRNGSLWEASENAAVENRQIDSGRVCEIASLYFGSGLNLRLMELMQ